MTFYEWLTEQVGRPDWIGDLASDAVGKRDVPRGDADYDTWLDHLQTNNASDGAIEAFNEAWEEYLSS